MIKTISYINESTYMYTIHFLMHIWNVSHFFYYEYFQILTVLIYCFVHVWLPTYDQFLELGYLCKTISKLLCFILFL